MICSGETFIPVGLGDTQQETPTASFEFTYLNSDTGDSDPVDEIEISHDGGDTIAASSIDVLIDGDRPITDGEDRPSDPYIGYPWTNGGGAGDVMRVEEVQPSNPCCAVSDVINPGDTAEVVWHSSDGEQSSVIADDTVTD